MQVPSGSLILAFHFAMVEKYTIKTLFVVVKLCDSTTQTQLLNSSIAPSINQWCTRSCRDCAPPSQAHERSWSRLSKEPVTWNLVRCHS